MAFEKHEIENKIENKNKLLNFLGRTISMKNNNSNIMIVYSLFSIIKLDFDFNTFCKKDVDLKLFKESTKGNFGGVVSYNKNSKEFNIKISLYKNETNKKSWDDFINEIVSNNNFSKIASNLSFVYFHEMLHLFQRHLVYNKSYVNFTNNEIAKKPKNEQKYLLEKVDEINNIGQDFYINDMLKKTNMFDISFKNPFFIYDESYNSSSMTEFDIIKDIISNYKVKVTEVNDFISLIEIENDDKDVPNLKYYSFKNIEDININEGNSNISSDDMLNEINNMIYKLKGSGSISILSELGIPIKVKLPWINRLQNTMERESQVRTKKTRLSWGKSQMFNRSFKRPGNKFVDLHSNIYVVMDLSGSMSNEEVRKINFMLLQLNKNGADLNLILHTSEIEEIVKIERKSKRKLDEFVKYRKYSGGTSHKDVFNYLDNELVKNIDQKQSIVLIVSDFESDIEEIWNSHTWTKGMVKKIFLNTVGDVSSKLENIIRNKNIEYHKI